MIEIGLGNFRKGHPPTFQDRQLNYATLADPEDQCSYRQQLLTAYITGHTYY